MARYEEVVAAAENAKAAAENAKRGSGRTTRQMRGAPAKALFVWCNDQVEIAREIARKSGVKELEIAPLSILDNPSKFAGREFSRVILDHAVPNLTARQWDGFDHLKAMVR